MGSRLAGTDAKVAEGSSGDVLIVNASAIRPAKYPGL